MNSWWMVNYLTNYHTRVCFLYFWGISFCERTVPHLLYLAPSCSKIDSRAPTALCMYQSIALASIMLDHSPRVRNYALSLLISHSKDFLRVWEITPIHKTLWSSLIKEEPNDAIKSGDDYQGDLSPTTQYAPFQWRRIFASCGKTQFQRLGI